MRWSGVAVYGAALCAALTACGTTVDTSSIDAGAPQGASLGSPAPGSTSLPGGVTHPGGRSGGSGDAILPGGTDPLTGGGGVGQPVGSGTSGGSVDPSGTSGSGGQDGSSTTDGGSTGDSTGAGASSGTGGSDGQTGTGGSGGTVPTASSLAVSKSVIRIGLAVPDADPAARFLGQDPAAPYEDVGKAIVADLNARGGLAGRKVELRVAKVGSANNYGEAVQAQELACVALTEDAHSDIVVGTDAGAAYATGCYAKHQTPVLVQRHVLDTADVLKAAPWVLPAASASFSDIAAAFPETLKAQGYLDDKIAVVTYDLPATRGAVERVLIPGLNRAGGTVIGEAYLPPSFTDAGAAIANAVLRFRRAGVDHVVFLSGLWPLFTQYAAAQAYSPRYAITTEELPRYSYEGFQVQPAQARGAVGMGWLPALDLTGAGQTALTANERRCFAAIRRYSGISYADRATAPTSTAWTCARCSAPWRRRLSRVSTSRSIATRSWA